jgi:hypothetical protein
MGLGGARDDCGLDVAHAVEVSGPPRAKPLGDGGGEWTLRIDDVGELGSI